MKRILSLLLAVAMLCTSAAALDLSEYEKALNDLKNSAFFSELFDSEEAKAKTQELIDTFRGAHEDIKAMSDDQLRQYILDTAEKHKVPDLNEEQIAFLMSLCRSLESVEKFGATVKEYEEKANAAADTAKNLFDTVGKLLDKLNQVLEILNNLLDKFGLNEQAVET